MVDPRHVHTLAELKESGYTYRPVRREMAENLADRLRHREHVFPGIHGYEDTVMPQLFHAVLAGHNIALLGEKGQAKSRLMRSLCKLSPATR